MNTNTRSTCRIVRLRIPPARLFTPKASGRVRWRATIRFQKLNLTAQILTIMILLAGARQAMAQPTIVSTVPTSGATSVTPGAAVVFNFSTAMNPAATYVVLSDVTASNESPTVILGWNAVASVRKQSHDSMER